MVRAGRQGERALAGAHFGGGCAVGLASHRCLLPFLIRQIDVLPSAAVPPRVLGPVEGSGRSASAGPTRRDCDYGEGSTDESARRDGEADRPYH